MILFPNFFADRKESISQSRPIGGKLPRVNTDWKMLKGRHGGGTGDGLPHARLSFLKQVYLHYNLSS